MADESASSPHGAMAEKIISQPNFSDLLVPQQGAAFGTQTSQEQALLPHDILAKIIMGVGHSIAEGVKFPGNYMKSYQPGQSVAENPEAAQWSAEQALGLVGGGTPFAKSDAAGVGGGKLGTGKSESSGHDIAYNMLQMGGKKDATIKKEFVKKSQEPFKPVDDFELNFMRMAGDNRSVEAINKWKSDIHEKRIAELVAFIKKQWPE